MSRSIKREKLIDGAAMSGNATSDKMSVQDNDIVSMQIVWGGASHTDAVAKLQQSVDGTNFEDVASMTHTLNAASGSKLLLPGAIYCPFVRVVYTNGSNTTGSVTVYVFAR